MWIFLIVTILYNQCPVKYLVIKRRLCYAHITRRLCYAHIPFVSLPLFLLLSFQLNCLFYYSEIGVTFVLKRAWKFIGDRLQRPNYLSRTDHGWKIRNRRQRTDIGKYSFVNRTIRHWNRLPAEILGTLPCKPCAFRKRVRKVINMVN